MSRRVLILLTIPLAALAFVALAQECPVTTDVATYPNPSLTYPMTSDRYAVEYQLSNSGTWTTARVYISYYGGTNSSPYIKASRYAADTSMSFVSIPAATSTAVAVRVTKIWGSNFPAISQMSIRPAAKGIQISPVSATTIQFSTTTSADFAGEQFVVWWNGDTQQSSSIQGLAVFLDPPYTRPTGSNVKIVATPADLTGDLSKFDTLDFEGTVAVASTGDQAFIVPANISNVFLAPGAWVQGKLRFAQSGVGNLRRTYGPGVLDVSRFDYMYRQCRNSTMHTDDGYQSVSSIPAAAGAASVADKFVFDGLIVSDSDYYATDSLTNTTVNNMKIIGWNGNNDGFQFGLTALATNVFVRTGDDSLKMWGSYITIKNATVWQNWNGGVVNLGWATNSPGDDCLIDGLYVVRTDWRDTITQSWTADTLNAQNDAIVASLMTPGSKFGTLIPSVYRNIYVDDSPQVLLSLKILPPDCALTGQVVCPPLNASATSTLNLNIENVFTPPSVIGNSIGFQTVNGATLTGSMKIGLTNVMFTLPNGTVTALNSTNAAGLGGLVTNGSNINIEYSSVPNATVPPVLPTGAAVNGASFAAGAPIAPGSIASVFGSGFGSSQTGVTVLMGGVVAPLFAVSPQQINFQVPWQLSGQTQTTLSVTAGGLTSASVTVPLASQAPGIFLLNSSGVAAAFIGNTNSAAAPVGTFPGSRPVQPGEYLTIYCTGLGPVTNQPATGAAPGATLSMTRGNPTVSIGGVPATVSFSGLTPGYVGLYQINVQVPSTAPAGSAVRLTIGMGGVSGNPANIAVAAAPSP